MKRVHVAVGVVINQKGEILIAKRPEHAHQGGLWEFPGGKVEEGESLEQALRRELFEELGLTGGTLSPLLQIRHDYSDKSVLLDVCSIQHFDESSIVWRNDVSVTGNATHSGGGVAIGKEGQPLCWVNSSELDLFQFPAANGPIVNAIQLPTIIAITPEFTGESVAALSAEFDQWWRGTSLATDTNSRSIAGKSYAVLLRQPLLSEVNPDRYQALLEHVSTLCKANTVLCFSHQPVSRFVVGSADGLHVTSKALPAISMNKADHDTDNSVIRGDLATILSLAEQGVWLGASCHSPEELQKAKASGCHYAFLSPVKNTQSHPQATPLGWPLFQQWVQPIAMPVYALGGMSKDDLDTAKEHGAQGVAAINSWLA